MLRMIHQRQGLPLRLKAGDHLLGVHPQLDDLQGHQPLEGTLLLGQVDDPEAAFPEHTQQLVASDATADPIQGFDSVQGPREILILLPNMVIVLAHRNSPAVSLSGTRILPQESQSGHTGK